MTGSIGKGLEWDNIGFSGYNSGMDKNYKMERIQPLQFTL
jgi:hypothetical protein